MSLSSILRALVAALIAATPAAQAAAQSATTLTVHADRPGAKIDRNIFGHFAEHLGTGIYGGVWVGPDSPIPNVRGIRSDVVAALKELKVPNVRWPGGCFADEYHWRHGIGAPEQRRRTINANWGNAIDPNTFGTHEFMDFVEQIGTEAYISINVGSGTPQEAAEWIEYMTAPATTTAGQERAANGRTEPYKVKYLGIGNESWGCGGSMTADDYVGELKKYARFVRNYNPAQTGDESMQRIAVGPDTAQTEYTEAVMEAWKNKVWAWDMEGLSLHYYTNEGWPPKYASLDFGEGDYAKLIRETLRMDGLIKMHSAIMDKHDPEKKIPLVVDEWGVWLAPLPGSDPGFLVQQNSLRDGIIAALNFNIFARHADRVRMANIAQMVNVLQAVILTDGQKMVLTPTYHVHRMYVPFQDATFIPLSLDAGTYTHGEERLPRLDAIAARDTDGRLWMALVNVDPNQPARISAAVPGVRVTSASGEVLTAPGVDAINTYENPGAVTPRPIAGRVRNGNVEIELPPKSVTVLQLGS